MNEKPKNNKKVLKIILVILILVFVIVVAFTIYNKVFFPQTVFSKSLDLLYEKSNALLESTPTSQYDFEKEIISLDNTITYDLPKENPLIEGLSQIKLTANIGMDYSKRQVLAKIGYHEDNKNILNTDVLLNKDNYAYYNLEDIYNGTLRQYVGSEYQTMLTEFVESLKKQQTYQKDISRTIYLTKEIVKKNIDKKAVSSKNTTLSIDQKNFHLTEYNYTLSGENLYNNISNIIADMKVNEELTKLLFDNFGIDMEDFNKDLQANKEELIKNTVSISIYGKDVYSPVGLSYKVNKDTDVTYLAVDGYYLMSITNGKDNVKLEGNTNSDNQVNLTLFQNNEKQAKLTYQKQEDKVKASISSIDDKTNIMFEMSSKENSSKCKITPIIDNINYGDITIESNLTTIKSLDHNIRTSGAKNINSLTDSENQLIENNFMKKAQNSKLITAITTIMSGNMLYDTPGYNTDDYGEIN